MNANRRVGLDVHFVWCMAHRLNLVVQDFKEVENINFVIKFAKWITASERLVSYSVFLQMNPRQKKEKDPTTVRDSMAVLQGHVDGNSRPG